MDNKISFDLNSSRIVFQEYCPRNCHGVMILGAHSWDSLQAAVLPVTIISNVLSDCVREFIEELYR